LVEGKREHVQLSGLGWASGASASRNLWLVKCRNGNNCEANMARVFAGGWLILLNSLLLVLLISTVGDLKSDVAGTSTKSPALTNRKLEDRAPAGDLQNPSLRNLPARAMLKTGLGNGTVLSKASQGSMWDHGGSIVRLEAIGRARRFYFVQVYGAFPAKNGDLAFEGVREGPTYSGRAFQFADNCAPLAFLVKGSVSADESTVKMQGRKPQRSAQCDIVSYVNEELVFSLTSKL
jgi:hypothetical protein